VAFAGKLSFATNEARNCAVAGLTVMVGSGDRAAVCVLGEGVRTAAKRADDESRWTMATVHIVSKPVATRTLGKERTAYKGFDGASVNAKEGRWAMLHQLEARAVGVVEGKNNARGVLAGGKVGWVSKPVWRKKDFTAVTDSVMGKFALKVLRGGSGTIGFAADGDATDDNMLEASDWNARAEGGAEGGVINRDVFGGGGALEGEDEVFPEGVGGGPPAREKFEGGADGVKAVSHITHKFAGGHSVEKGGLCSSVVEDNGVISASERFWEGAGLMTLKGHGVGRGGGERWIER